MGVFGRSSFETWQQIRRVDDLATLASEGGAKVVWVDQQLEKSLALPEEIRARLMVPVA